MNTDYNIYGAFPLHFVSPCWFPFVPLSNPLLLTWNPPSCDRIRPPRSQVACKLPSPVPTLSPNPPPSKFPEPQLPSASLRRPQVEYGIFCPEQVLYIQFRYAEYCTVCWVGQRHSINNWWGREGGSQSDWQLYVLMHGMLSTLVFSELNWNW
jgi:hypothetical protein